MPNLGCQAGRNYRNGVVLALALTRVAKFPDRETEESGGAGAGWVFAKMTLLLQFPNPLKEVL